MEVVSRSHKQVEVDNNARDVRLNRALEDVEKYKAIIAKNNQESKVGIVLNSLLLFIEGTELTLSTIGKNGHGQKECR